MARFQHARHGDGEAVPPRPLRLQAYAAALGGSFCGLAPFSDDVSFESRNVAEQKTVRPLPVRFTPEQFARATAQLLPDIEALETYLGRPVSTQWDLSAERWLKPAV